MSFLDTLKGLFGRKPDLPTAPKPSSEARRYWLTKDDDLIWSTVEEARKALGNSVAIVGKVIDLKGGVIDGTKLPRPKDSQNENAIALVIAGSNFTLTNGWVRGIPGGIVVKRENCAFEKLKFIDIGEDALSTVGEDATGIRISSCEFWNDRDGDKSIQLNQAYGSTIRNCRIVGGVTGARIQKDSYKTPNVTCVISGTTFEGCETGFNVAGKATVRLTDSKFKNVKKQYVTGSGSRVLK